MVPGFHSIFFVFLRMGPPPLTLSQPRSPHNPFGVRDAYFSADLLFIRVLPLAQLRVEGAGEGDQKKEGDENAILQPFQHSSERPGEGRVGSMPIV